MNKKTKIIYYTLIAMSVVASFVSLCFGNFAIAIWGTYSALLLYWAFMWHDISWQLDKSLDDVIENSNALYHQKQKLDKENKALKAQVEKMEKELHNLPYRDEKGVYRKR